jgi:hypothetical protein
MTHDPDEPIVIVNRPGAFHAYPAGYRDPNLKWFGIVLAVLAAAFAVMVAFEIAMSPAHAAGRDDDPPTPTIDYILSHLDAMKEASDETVMGFREKLSGECKTVLQHQWHTLFDLMRFRLCENAQQHCKAAQRVQVGLVCP